MNKENDTIIVIKLAVIGSIEKSRIVRFLILRREYKRHFSTRGTNEKNQGLRCSETGLDFGWGHKKSKVSFHPNFKICKCECGLVLTGCSGDFCNNEVLYRNNYMTFCNKGNIHESNKVNGMVFPIINKRSILVFHIKTSLWF